MKLARNNTKPTKRQFYLRRKSTTAYLLRFFGFVLLIFTCVHLLKQNAQHTWFRYSLSAPNSNTELQILNDRFKVVTFDNSFLSNSVEFEETGWKAGELIGEVNTEYQIDSTILINGVTTQLENLFMSWTGARNKDLMQIKNSERVRLRNFTFLGRKENSPRAAISLLADTLSNSNNANIIIEDGIIGRTLVNDTPGERPFDYGIFVGGPFNGNNDETHVSNVQIHDANIAGVYIANPQSIWTSYSNMLINTNATGFYTSANTTVNLIGFNRNTERDFDIHRNIEVWVNGFFAENSIQFARSRAGASLYARDGKLLRTFSAPQSIFDWQAGGNLSLVNILILNSKGDIDNIKYRPTSITGGRIQIKNSEITSRRDFYDIHTAGLGVTPAAKVIIDIDLDGLRWYTELPYADVYVAPQSIETSRSGLLSVDAAVPFGNFYNISLGASLDGMQLGFVHSRSTAIRGRVMNNTGLHKALNGARLRIMNLAEHVELSTTKTIDFPQTPNDRSVTIDVKVPGVRLGDYVAAGVKYSFDRSIPMVSVSDDDTVSVTLYNLTGRADNPVPTEFVIGHLEKFGNYKGCIELAPRTIFSETTAQTFSVPVKGAQLGAHTFFAFSERLNGLFVTAEAQADRVNVTVVNRTGANVVLRENVLCAMVAF